MGFSRVFLGFSWGFLGYLRVFLGFSWDFLGYLRVFFFFWCFSWDFLGSLSFFFFSRVFLGFSLGFFLWVFFLWAFFLGIFRGISFRSWFFSGRARTFLQVVGPSKLCFGKGRLPSQAWTKTLQGGVLKGLEEKDTNLLHFFGQLQPFWLHRCSESSDFHLQDQLGQSFVLVQAKSWAKHLASDQRMLCRSIFLNGKRRFFGWSRWASKTLIMRTQ